MTRRRTLVLTAALAVALVVAACGPIGGEPAAGGPSGTLAVGQLPGVPPTAGTGPSAIIPVPIIVPTTTGPPLEASGRRVLMIGDSILAGTAERYGGLMCEAIVPRGWRVAVEAEVSQRIGFALEVERARLSEGWDVGLIFLGTNHDGDAASYEQQLDQAVEAFGDAPVILVTVTERNAQMGDVNDRIRAVAASHPNVRLLDWANITATYPALLVKDGIHPTGMGHRVLVDQIASVLGDAPGAAAGGGCLESQFVDDGRGLAPGVMPTTTVRPSGGGSSTTLPATSTTKPSSSTTTVAPTTDPPTTTTEPSG